MADTIAGRYNERFFEEFIKIVKGAYAAFDGEAFLRLIYDEEWETRAFKARMRHIADVLRQTLPPSYREALSILERVAPQCTGVEYLFFPDFVEAFGLEDWDASIAALEAFTPYSSSEFAVRPFILKYGEQMINVMLQWAEHSDHHVRRLASEGCRPRLPWAMALEQYKADPTPLLPILEKLKRDEYLYVRKSVANHINDIAKDHPQLVIELARSWYGKHEHTDWIVRHGCRGLLRKGDAEILTLFGFQLEPDVTIVDFVVEESRINIGQSLHFAFTISNNLGEGQRLRVEYGIDFVKANGKTSRKLFKIADHDIEQRDKRYVRVHHFKDLTTRKHYPGMHAIAIVINGVELATKEFNVD